MVVRPESLSGKLAFLFLLIPICFMAFVMLFMKKDLIWIAQRLF
jgi:hypothetical protein